MTFPFDPHQGLIVVRTELNGPSGRAMLRLALDTGATTTLINAAMLVSVGYDPALTTERSEVTTGSGVEFAPIVEVSRIAALGEERERLPILCHTLPPTAGVDGVLGLDFFRHQVLTIDFRRGQIILV